VVAEPTVPCLSVRQPWADLIVSGIKDVENRRWPTSFRGLVLVHAPRTVEEREVPRAASLLRVPAEEYVPVTGAIVGATEIVDCVTQHESRFFAGPYGFVLRNSRQFTEPVPFPGRLGLFPVPWRYVRHLLPAAEVER
jgi:ASCH domain